MPPQLLAGSSAAAASSQRKLKCQLQQHQRPKWLGQQRSALIQSSRIQGTGTCGGVRSLCPPAPHSVYIARRAVACQKSGVCLFHGPDSVRCGSIQPKHCAVAMNLHGKLFHSIWDFVVIVNQPPLLIPQGCTIMARARANTQMKDHAADGKCVHPHCPFGVNETWK
jgi:hypothetical protein